MEADFHWSSLEKGASVRLSPSINDLTVEDRWVMSLMIFLARKIAEQVLQENLTDRIRIC